MGAFAPQPLPNWRRAVLKVGSSLLAGDGDLAIIGSGLSMADSVVETALTPREMDVLQLLGDGLDNKTISLRLDIALGTVKSHVRRAFQRLQGEMGEGA